MKKRRNLYYAILALIMMSVAFYGCTEKQAGSGSGAGTVNSVQQAEAGYRDISGEELKAKMDSDKSLLVVDVREQAEFQEGRIPGSKLIPLGEFESRAGEIPKDKAVVLVCATGARSAMAADYLIRAGYREVYNLQEGIVSWTYNIEK